MPVSCWPRRTGAGAETEAQFLDSFLDGTLLMAKLTEADIARMAQLVRRYADFPLTGADYEWIVLSAPTG